jgi:signal transduction histidine kinase
LIGFYSEKGDKDLAIIYAQKALDLSEKINSPAFRKKALSNLLKLEEKPWYIEYIEIEDEFREKELEQDAKFSHVKYDVKNERKIALEQKLRIEAKNKLQRLIFIGVGILLFVSGLFIFYILKLKHKKEKTKEVIRETFQTERRLSKKVHDELANDMSDTLNYVDNHTDIPNDIKTHLVNKLDDIYDRTRDISAEIGGFESKDFAKNLKFLITQHRTEGVKVITNVMTGINWNKISDHKKINIYRSLQELLVNMKKHSKATEVTVIFKSEENKNFINYMDNGIGVAIDDVHIRGLQNVETRMKNIGGSVTFITSKGNGFKARLYFLN